ncbi:hypothetical protein [Pinibacter aurantiacus]|uniref:Uncharacterized protein n=1 Tax=Pinibacter aurantiacus TaxID=2851599 RepID=A0A9E2S6J4_9BACT|nr:hypothetical protein [Pinibacter aurantiacus]MBV4357518.1 hypothetical protein [Pinibacter aurantiacus]
MPQRRLFSLIIVSFTIISTLSVCKPSSKVESKPQKVSNSQPVTNDRCSQTITYHADKLSEQGNEVAADVDLVINPTTKIISLHAEIPSAQQKVNFDTVIESIDCNLNSDLTEGYSIYKGYIVQQDGTSTKATLKVEAKDGKIKIFDPAQINEHAINVSKWTAAP